MAIYEVYQKCEKAEAGGKIVLRDEQMKAVRAAKNVFKKSFGEKNPFHKFLWNAKMRFGKTLCAMQLAKEMNVKRTLIVTHRPVVNRSWAEDFEKIFEKDDHWRYGTKFEKDEFGDFNTLERFAAEDGNHYVFFASMQYLRLSALVKDGGDQDMIKKKILENQWDLVVVDEAHEGTQTSLGHCVVEMLSKPKTNILHLSGTPFNLYDDFETDEIFTWDYIAEQRAKDAWNNEKPMLPNPYAELPRMKIFTYDLGELVGGEGLVREGAGFMFSEFFRTWTGNTKLDGAKMPDGAKGRFVHEADVTAFLDLLCKKDETSNYPFSTDEYRKNFKHTLWVVPGVKEAKALEALLTRHEVFRRFRVINVAGQTDEDVEDDNALNRVLTAIGNLPEKRYTITISCGRLTTGTTVRPWTAVFYMKGSENTNVATYMQTIFRVQTPYHTADGRMKAEAYVFDFAPDRSLRMLAETARFTAKGSRDKLRSSSVASQMELEAMKELLNFCPVVSYEGGRMKAFNDEHALFAKLAEAKIDRVVRKGFDDNALYNVEELLKMNPDAVNTLLTVLGRTASTKKAEPFDIATAGLGGKGPKNGAPEGGEAEEKDDSETDAKKAAEKAAKKERDNRIAILRGVSLRIPLLMFGAEVADEDKDVTIDNFASHIDDASWEEFMPRGFTKKNFDEIKGCYDQTVFRDSWRRYRQLAQDADRMKIEDRIQAITTIFSYFHNPDKETVLTPWHVVNMHMAVSIGGWCFFNEKFDGPNLKEIKRGESVDLVETNEPRWVEQKDVTNAIFKQADKDGDTPVKILEINSKTGLYPLYVTYSLYRSILPIWQEVKGENGVLLLSEEQALWDKILQENIFVICNTPMATRITERTLRGFRHVEGLHIKDEKLVNQAIKEQDALVKKLNSQKFWFEKGTGEMKFNAVVGNPPYQLKGKNDGNRDNPIYHMFYDTAFELSDRVSLISPGRFLFNAGQTPKTWNEKMLGDEHLKVARYWSKSSDLFPNVDIKGGVAVIWRDKHAKFTPIGVFTVFPELNSILRKVVAKEDGRLYLDSIISSRGHYRFSKKAFADHPEILQAIGDGTGNMIASNAFRQLPKIFLISRPKKGDFIELIGRLDNERVSRFISAKYLENNEYLASWNVLVPEANGTGAIGEVLSTPMIGLPMIGSTDTFISVGRFSAPAEAENCLKYIKTKFARTMLGVLKATQHNPKATWRYVPMQDFTAKSDIDWSRPIPQIDKQLYDKYGLSKSERDFIESMIKPME